LKHGGPPSGAAQLLCKKTTLDPENDPSMLKEIDFTGEPVQTFIVELVKG